MMRTNQTTAATTVQRFRFFSATPELPADLDWENVEPKVLDSRMVKAVTVDGTIVRGRTVAVHGSLDQLIVEGILQPLLMRLPGEHWRLASGWKSLVFYNKTKEQ